MMTHATISGLILLGWTLGLQTALTLEVIWSYRRPVRQPRPLPDPLNWSNDCE